MTEPIDLLAIAAHLLKCAGLRIDCVLAMNVEDTDELEYQTAKTEYAIAFEDMGAVRALAVELSREAI